MTKPKAENKAKNSIVVDVHPSETEEQAKARVLTKPEVLAASTLHDWQGGLADVNALASELSAQIGKVNSGNMERAEAMLLAQAHTLDKMFNNLATRAYRQDGLYQLEALLRLALKAQSQSRTTLETLSNIKNPPVIFAKQANIANGHQQINNAPPATHGGEIKNQQNELLSELPNETLDTGRTGETITANQAVETLE